MQSKVPCPKCGVLYAWNASQKRVRNHGSCRFDTPAPKKPSFSVRIAPPQANVSDNVRVANVWGYDADQLQSDKKKTEDEYRKNSASSTEKNVVQGLLELELWCHNRYVRGRVGDAVGVSICMRISIVGLLWLSCFKSLFLSQLVKKLLPPTGIEPVATGLKVLRSAD